LSVRLLVVSDSWLYRDSLEQELEARSFSVSVAMTDSAVSRVSSYPPDVVLVDVRRLDALRLVHELAVLHGTRVVAVELADGDLCALACAEAGAIGAVRSSATLDELVGAVSSALAGEAVFPPSVVAHLVQRVAALTTSSRLRSLPTGITRREREVLALMTEGLSNKEIAGRLNLELATVKNHVHRILRKLDVQRRTQAAAAFRACEESFARADGSSVSLSPL
jgi:DNA-binding NarL/FixJ family response regulator